MHAAQDVIKATVSSLHGRYLKGLGFHKSGSTWVRGQEWSEVINVQLSKWNSSEEAQLTLNFGIYNEKFHRATEGLPLKGGLKEYDCDLRVRIGSLHADKKDYWWTVVPATNPDHLADSLYDEIRVFGLSWFEGLNSLRGMATEFLTQKNWFKAAVAYQLAGLYSESREAMGRAYAESNDHARPRLLRVAKALAIPING